MNFSKPFYIATGLILSGAFFTFKYIESNSSLAGSNNAEPKVENQVSTNNSSDRTPSNASQQGYCMAIRGNGELEPAHWGAAAKTIEQLGIPQKMAGGSSATITMMLIEAMASNPLVDDSTSSAQVKGQRLAFMLKSLDGLFDEIKDSPQFQEFLKLYQKFNPSENKKLLETLIFQLQKKDLVAAQGTLDTAIKVGLINKELSERIFNHLKKGNIAGAQFVISELSNSITLFGKFDAINDSNIFFRPGVVNFKETAESVGKIASFYAGLETTEDQKKMWFQIIKTCADDSMGHLWPAIISSKPNCKSSFHNLTQSYFEKQNIPAFEMNPIGKKIDVLASTSVITKDDVPSTLKAMEDYLKTTDSKFGANFKLKNSENLKFGYWGNLDTLKRISSSLPVEDEKSRRFLSLGQAPWKTILSTSPAEPGLAPLQPFESLNTKLISAGGWSDLHPTTILKAAGCSRVVFLTRTGGESLFAQGIANRLMDLGRDSSLLLTQPPEKGAANAIINNSGDPKASPNSLWSMLFNMANPKSSINTALGNSSAILCTNWNSFDVKTQRAELIADSYKSEYWINPGENDIGLKPLMNSKKPGCSP